MKERLELIRWKSCPILNQLSDTELQAIRPYLHEQKYRDRDVILRQGQSSGSFHIVIEGRLDVCLEDEVLVSVAQLGPGQFVGEMSCLTGEPVSATVKAIGTVYTLSMPREGMIQLMDSSPTFRRHMLEAMVKRIQQSNHRVMDEHTRSYVVMKQLESERESRLGKLVGSSPFMKSLRDRIQILAQQDGPLIITGEDGVGKFHTAREIHNRSKRSHHPIITLDANSLQLEEWRMKVRAAKGGTIVVRNVDQLEPTALHTLMSSAQQVRFVLTGRQAPNHVRAERVEMIPLRERKEDIPDLVFEFLARAEVYDPQHSITPEALRALTAFPYLQGNIEELARVIHHALVLSEGRTIRSSHLKFGSARKPGERPKIGLALGSGSVRGAAHVGVMKVLEEEHIPIDYIAGTSVGAFIGALYAGGQPISAFERVLPTVRWRQLVSPILPPRAFVNNLPMTKFVEKYIGPVTFDQLSIPFAAVAADAVTGEACILNKGRVSHAICASTAIPGVMRPVEYEQRLLMDGAVVHPVPAALVRSMGADIVIAVDVSAPSFMRRSPRNFVASILNTIDIMSQRIVQEEMQLADVVLKPQLDIQEITFKQSTAFIQKGVEVTRESLDLLRAKIKKAES